MPCNTSPLFSLNMMYMIFDVVAINSVTRLSRVAFLRRWHKNAKCINRGVRFPRALPWAMGNIWAYSPPQSFTGRLCKLVRFQQRFLDTFFEIFGCARQYEQALLHSFARKFGCARHSPNKFGSALACTKICGGSA